MSPRPCKQRRINGRPNSFLFKPAGIPAKELEELELTLEEFEALRLKDFLGLEQIECAQKMNVSQPTFHRLVVCARQKLSDCIVNGKVIKIKKN
ncbi:DUF134 domain-containing protein [Candidatus Woesearchaeota archaeon]|nr:DUF134 domain-containing protein [Candidatus Woesearchaeota archaeon]